MGAMPSTCTVYISSIATTYRYTWDLRVTYCQEVVHEVGHLAGVGHTAEYGLMHGGPAYDEFAPRDCVRWRSFARSYRRVS
jgi:predicted Zn-dependent protease